jgi:mannosyltransferase
MSAQGAAPATARAESARLPGWWPLAAITLLAALLRLPTLGLQSFWYDEAFTPVHVLHPSLTATLHSMVHTENSPPLWYIVEWLDYRLLGTGEVALRLPSALAGIVTVPVAWAIGRELTGRRAATLCALLVAVNPLFVWYSQEARVYGLFVLMSALAMLCFLRAEARPTRGRMMMFALTGALAMLTHYFAVFLLIPMVLLLLFRSASRRAALGAVGILVLVGLALIPLVLAQGGHGTQWIGEWPLAERLEAIPQYYLLGTSGAPLGHGVQGLIALVILAGVGFGAWLMLDLAPTLRAPRTSPGDEESVRARSGAGTALAITAGGVLLPVLLGFFGADYLAPRNLVGAMIPATALIAVLVVSPPTGRWGVALGATIALAFLMITIDVNLSPRLQRGNWRDLASALKGGPPERAITTVELGSAPLEYYMPPLHNLAPGTIVLLREIDETGYSPLRKDADLPPAPGFHLVERLDVDGLIAYRFRSARALPVSEAELRRHVITLAHPEVLVPGPAGGG